MKSLKVSTCSPERKPSVARRSVLGAIAAGAALSSTSATSTIFPNMDLTTDSVLIGLWRQLLDVLDALDVNRASYERAVASLPAWAWGQDSAWPAWTPDMLAAHEIPASMGDRFSDNAVKKLNDQLSDRAFEPLFAANGCSFVDIPTGAKNSQIFEVAERQGAIRRGSANHPEIVAARQAAESRLRAWADRTHQRRAEFERVGMPALDEAWEGLSDQRDAIMDQITATPHQSSVGMMIRLRAWLLFKAITMEGETLDDLGGSDAMVVFLVREAEASDAAMQLPLPASLRKVLGGEA